jgi:O-antigen/teichoic acid export membrane protein
VALIAAAINIVLNFLLIPRWGVEGAAASTTAAFAVWALLSRVFAERLTPLPIPWGSISVAALVALAASGTAALCPGPWTAIPAFVVTYLCGIGVYWAWTERLWSSRETPADLSHDVGV